MNGQDSELARLDVRDTAGVFAARQLGRGLAAVLALEQQDQIRVATALSEVSRSAVTAGRTAVITFGIDGADLLVTVSVDGEPPADGTRRGGPARWTTVAADGRVRADDQDAARPACGRIRGWSASSWPRCSRGPPWTSCSGRTRT